MKAEYALQILLVIREIPKLLYERISSFFDSVKALEAVIVRHS
jgi:hypothetical protein